MISVICTVDVRIRDSLSNILSLEKTDETSTRTLYQKGKWILVFFHRAYAATDLEWIATSYLPDRLYLPFIGSSIDLIHEVGDVIVPNVFLHYDPSIADRDISPEDRDAFMGTPTFLTHLPEQKDYYVEDFGLSLGGIVVSESPEIISEHLAPQLMTVYEGDVYISEDVGAALDIVRDESITSLILCGVTQGKPSQYSGQTQPVDQAMRNIVTAIRLMEEDE